MTATTVRITFARELPWEDVLSSLLLARWAAEALHGEPAVALEARHHFDSQGRACVIDAACAAGRDLVRIFVGYLQREFQPAAFTIERLAPDRTVAAAV